MYLMTIDAGTGSVRAVLFNLQGEQIAMAQQEWIHLAEPNVPHSMNFDFNTNWSLCCQCIKKAIQQANIQPKDILAVTASSMREGIVLYDKDGQPIWAVANVDARASQEVKQLKTEFPNLEADLYQRTGQTFALGALPRLLWLKNNRPKLYDKCHTFSMISDWVIHKLSGIIGVDPSNGGTSGLLDLHSRQWLSTGTELINTLSLPRVYESGTVIGHVIKSAAEETALSTTTLVVMGGGDVQLGAAGLDLVRPGEAAILGGSFWQQIVNVDAALKPPKNRQLRVNPHVITHLSQVEAITFFSGLVMRWFRDAFCQAEKLQAQQAGKDVYDLLQAKAALVPVGSYGVMPIFSDTMKYDKWYHASPSFINLNIQPEKCNNITLFRSLLENAAIVSALNLQKIDAMSPIKTEAIVFAAGASKGQLWSQIVADVLNRPLKIPKVKEATALGGAFAAGVGAGVYTTMAEAAEHGVQWERTVEPIASNHQQYLQLMDQWQAIYNKQLALVDQGLTEAMWQAPGF